MKDYSSLCMHCMLDANGLDVCPHCGHENADTAAYKHHLAPGTTLARERYIVGRSVLTLDKEIWYAGFDTATDTRVFIREYFVRKYITQRNKSGSIVTDTYASDAFEDAKKKFKAQLKIEMSLNSSYTTNISKVFLENNTVYAITEWLDGISMPDYLKENPTCPSLYVIQNLSQQIGDALQALNSKGYAHTGLSPERIWMCKDGTVRIIDYSCIQPLSKHRKLGRNKPNPFVAQEVYNSKAKLTPASDVYSLAAIMYTIITGSTPNSESEGSLQDSLSNVRLPQAMKAAIIKALSYNPTARYRSIKLFLKNFSKDKPAVKYKAQHHQKKMPGTRPKLNAVGVVASVLVMLLGLLFIFMSFSLKTVSYYYLGDVSDEIRSSVERASSVTGRNHILYNLKQTDDINDADMIIYAADQYTALSEVNDIDIINCSSLYCEASPYIMQQYMKQQNSGTTNKLPIDIDGIYIYYKSDNYIHDDSDNNYVNYINNELINELFGNVNGDSIVEENSAQDVFPKSGTVETKNEGSEVNFREEPNTSCSAEDCKKISGGTEINIVGSIELVNDNLIIKGVVRMNGDIVDVQSFPKEKISEHDNSSLWYCVEYPAESEKYGFIHSNYIKFTFIDSESGSDAPSDEMVTVAVICESDTELEAVKQSLLDSGNNPKYKNIEMRVESIEIIEDLLDDGKYKFIIAKFTENANSDNIGCIPLKNDKEASLVYALHFISFVKNESLNKDVLSEFTDNILENSLGDVELDKVRFMN